MAKVKDSISKPEESVAQAAVSLANDEVSITHPDQLNEIQEKNKLAGFSGWFFSKGVDEEGNEIRVPSVNDKGEHVFVKGAKAICKVALSLLLAIGLLSNPAYAAVDPSDESVMGNNRWSVQSDGDLVPGADSTYDIGASGAEVAEIYTDSVFVGALTTTGTVALGDTATVTAGGGDKTTVIGQLYIPYYTDATRPASGLALGTIALMKGANNNDCGVSDGVSTTWNLCVSDGTDWQRL